MNENKLGCITGVIALVICAVIVFFACVGSFNDAEYTLTVTDKERVVTSNGESVDSYFLVYAEDENDESYVFRNSDELLRGKFNSSNIQGAIKIGTTYKFTVVGFRIPLFSAYQNIIRVEEVMPDA